MVINMDNELQRLICVSVEKMTREPVASRKGKGLDLRKALLVAHVLQDMRTAYIADDYQILVNTVCPETKDENIEKTLLRKEYNKCLTEDVINRKRRKFLSGKFRFLEYARFEKICYHTPYYSDPFSGKIVCIHRHHELAWIQKI